MLEFIQLNAPLVFLEQNLSAKCRFYRIPQNFINVQQLWLEVSVEKKCITKEGALCLLNGIGLFAHIIAFRAKL